MSTTSTPTSNFKIAYLIAAHTDPEHLNRLIDAIFIPGVTDIYLHIDKKSDISNFNVDTTRAKVIPTRVNTSWGSYAQCLYQKGLIDACIDSGVDYDRVFFLSGLDYPVWSNRKILDFLASDPKREYMGCVSISEENTPANQKMKIERYHPFRSLPIGNRILKRGLNLIGRLAMSPFRKKPYIMVEGRERKIYHGSSWWCVTLGCLKVIKEGMENQVFTRFFKTSYAPDELFPQTVVQNSGFADRTILYAGEKFPRLEAVTPLHYLEYNEQIKVLDESDFSKIIDSGKMFIRKARTGVSDKLLDKIDNLRNIEN